MRTLFLALLVLLSTTVLTAQSSFKRNDVYVEFPGNGIFGSINYERQLFLKPGLGMRIGLGYWSGDSKFRLSIPIGMNYLFSLDENNISFIDSGIGLTWASEDGIKEKPPSNPGHYIFNLVPSIGYRRHTRGGLMWRVSATPVFNKYQSFPFFGASIGKRF